MKRRDVENALRNYHWMVKEIARLRTVLEDAGEGVARQIDENSDMPKAQGRTSDPVFMEVSRRENHWRRIERLDAKVSFVQRHIDCIQDDRERTVLDCILDGMTFVAIALHMQISEKHIRRLKDSIVNQFCENAENAEKADLLQGKKVMV